MTAFRCFCTFVNKFLITGVDVILITATFHTGQQYLMRELRYLWTGGFTAKGRPCATNVLLCWSLKH
jgi:hypothetical protein